MGEQNDKTTTMVIKPPLDMPTTPMKVLLYTYVCALTFECLGGSNVF